jgi:lysozyme
LLSPNKKSEGIIDGLYDDQSGYCTFGVGHLVHQRHKWKCFLLETAAADEAWKKYVLKKKWSGKANETPYLTRGAAFADKFDELKAKAIATTKPAIALKKFGKTFDKLTQPEKDEATAAAKDVVGNQAKVLAKSPDGVFHEAIKPFEKAVNDSIKAKLTQEGIRRPGLLVLQHWRPGLFQIERRQGDQQRQAQVRGREAAQGSN